MNLQTWSLFFTAYLLITLAPGPNVLFVVQNALTRGYKEALLSIAGNLSCQLLLVILVAGGAGALLESSPKVFFVLKIIGGCYLISLGIKGLLGRRAAVTSKPVQSLSASATALAIYKKGFLVSASNPKTVIFLSAFLPQFISANHSIALQFIIMFITISAIVLIVHLSYSCIAKNIGARFVGSKVSHALVTFYNSAFIAFGGGLIFNSRS